MSLNLESKKAVVAGVIQALQSAQTVVLAQYAGVTVAKMTLIRARARKENVYLHVVKNTLVRKAVEGTKFAPLADKMVGQLVYGVSEDPVAAAKIINEFAKENDAVKIVAGMYNDKELDISGVKQLAAIPPRSELLGMVMGVMLEIPASFVRCLDAIKMQKEEAA
ncbi:MAG: 50S ribosomal protein L10 [Burkholderiales bacterium]|nr:50S ribosomal protein L10 [Burkholderiales bacterium]